MSLSYRTITTPRLTTAYLSAGTPGKPRLLLLHGNVSSAVFYEHLMERLADDFEMLAPDFRCFGHSSALPIDATRGMRDFSDDIAEFLHCVCGQFLTDLAVEVLMQHSIIMLQFIIRHRT